MAASPATAGSPEFMEQLYRGGELLSAGRVIEAKDHLERAYQLDPSNEKALNLLGLSYFKLGMFDRASEIYEALVRDNPADHTLRVNLGLVYLKSGALLRAVREFEIATDLQPDHQKAHNYLGLALAQLGEFGKAREHFVLAGSDVMAEKMARALEEASARAPSPGVVPPPAENRPPVMGSAPPPNVPQPRASEPPAQELFEEQPAAEMAQAAAVEEVTIDVTEPEPTRDPLGAQDWGAQLGGEDAQAPEPVAATEAPPSDDLDLRFAEDEGPSAPRAAPVEDAVPEPVAAAPVEPEPLFSEPEPEPVAEEAAAAEPAAPTPSLDEEADDLAMTMAAFETPQPSAWTQSMGEPAAPAEISAEEETPDEAPITLTPAERRQRAEPLAPVVDFPDSGRTFELAADGIRIRVRDEVRVRTDGLVAVWGELELTPENKRHHGRPTEKPFGSGARRMMRVSGQGALHLERGGHTFATLSLRDESVYLREETVFGLGEGLSFENGKLPSGEESVELLNASGDGQVLLRLPGELRTVEVTAARPVRVPLSAWVGWNGGVSARVVDGGPEGRPMAELTGEGFALLTLAMR